MPAKRSKWAACSRYSVTNFTPAPTPARRIHQRTRVGNPQKRATQKFKRGQHGDRRAGCVIRCFHRSSTEGRVGSPAERLVSARSAKCAHPLARAMKMPWNSAETFAASVMHSAASRLYSSAVGTRFAPSLCLSTQFGNPRFVPSGIRLKMGSFRVVTSGGPRMAYPPPAAAGFRRRADCRARSNFRRARRAAPGWLTESAPDSAPVAGSGFASGRTPDDAKPRRGGIIDVRDCVSPEIESHACGRGD
jgi:hypothetical protein